MSPESRRLAAILLILFPTAVWGGISLLSMLTDPGSGYAANPLRQDLWRAGHAHAAVLLVLSLIVLRYVDEAVLAPRTKALVRSSTPVAAILLPIAFFLSVSSPDASAPNALIYLAYVGAVILVAGLITLGMGLFRANRGEGGAPGRS